MGFGKRERACQRPGHVTEPLVCSVKKVHGTAALCEPTGREFRAALGRAGGWGRHRPGRGPAQRPRPARSTSAVRVQTVTNVLCDPRPRQRSVPGIARPARTAPSMSVMPPAGGGHLAKPRWTWRCSAHRPCRTHKLAPSRQVCQSVAPFGLIRTVPTNTTDKASAIVFGAYQVPQAGCAKKFQ